MINEISLNSSVEAHALAKEIARRGKISVAIVRNNDLYVVRSKPGIDISPYLHAISEKGELQKSLSSTSQENIKITTELEATKTKLSSMASEYKDKFQSIADEISNLFKSSQLRICTTCKGLGRSAQKCSECNGEGVKKIEKMNFNLCHACGGDGGISGNCYNCSGTGYKEDINYSPCETCNGLGAKPCLECNQTGFLGNNDLINFAKKICGVVGIDIKKFT